jgi:hypothetical protein
MLHTLEAEMKIKWMRCSLVVSISDNQQSWVQSQQPVRVHIGFWKATDEARWNKVYKKAKNTGNKFKDNGKETEGNILSRLT